jgi:hypothetical protein
VKKLGSALIFGSLLFFVETAFEMYVLTCARGPQMIWFSVAHVAPVVLILIMLSGLLYLCLSVFALAIVVARWIKRPITTPRYAKLMLVILAIQIIHSFLFLTYDRWSSLLFKNGG